MLQTLQVGRGLAALFVAAFHLSISFSDPRYLGFPVLQSVTWWGNRGVDFFFVLSGFIIMYAHERDIGRPEGWRHYALKRFIRIYPIYWLYTIVFCLLLAAGAGTVAKLPATPEHWLSVFSLVRFSLEKPVLPPAWTLYHEIVFYAVFSVLIVSRRWGLVALAVWTAAILVNTFGMRLPGLAEIYLSTRNIAFLVGIAAYLLWKRGDAATGRAALWTGIALVLAGLAWQGRTGSEGTWVLWTWSFGFGALLAGCVGWESRRGRTTSWPALAMLGNASYTIYLIHEPVQSLLIKIMMKVHAVVPLNVYFMYAVALSLSMALGCVAYLLVEKPLLKATRTWLLGDRRQPALAG